MSKLDYTARSRQSSSAIISCALFVALTGLAQTPAVAKAEARREKFQRPFAGSEMFLRAELMPVSPEAARGDRFHPEAVLVTGTEALWALARDLELFTRFSLVLPLADSHRRGKAGEVGVEDIPFGLRAMREFLLNKSLGLLLGGRGAAWVPSSAFSRGSTLYTSLEVDAQAGIVFRQVAGGLRIALVPEARKYFHVRERLAGSEIGAAFGPLRPSAALLSDAYTSLLYAGINPSWSAGGGVDIGLALGSRSRLGFAYRHRYVSARGPDPLRFHAQTFEYELRIGLSRRLAPLAICLGAATAGHQLTPDGRFRPLFFNRETAIQAGVALDVDMLVHRATPKKTRLKSPKLHKKRKAPKRPLPFDAKRSNESRDARSQQH